MTNIPIYIIGSVATKECFNKKTLNIYDNIFNIEGIQYQSSFISLFSRKLEGINRIKARIYNYRFNK